MYNRDKILLKTAFTYGQKVVDWCRDNKVSDTIKLSRAFKHIKNEFETNVFDESNEPEYIKYLNSINAQYFQLHMTLENALNSIYKSHRYLTVIGICLFSMMFCKLCSDKTKHVIALYKIMDAYIPGDLNLNEFNLHYQEQLDNIQKILENKLNQILNQ